MKRNGWMMLVLCAAVACGSKKDDKVTQSGVLGKDDKDKKPVEPELTLPALGMPAPDAWNFPWGKGEKTFDKAPALLKAKDWAGLQAAAEATIAADAGHLDAHLALAIALAQQNKADAVVGPLVVALAGDPLRFLPELDKNPNLAAYMGSPQGAKVKKLAADLREKLKDELKKGLWVVARRGSFRPPAKTGVQSGSTRGELFLFDADTTRWIRLTQTGFTLAAWMPAPGGDRIAYATWSKVALPEKEQEADLAPILSEAQVRELRLSALDEAPKPAVFKDVRALALAYDAGDKLTVTTFAADGRWGLKDARAFALDTTSGEAKPVKAPPSGGTRVQVTYDDVLAQKDAVDGVEADFRAESDAASTFKVTATQKTITLPSGDSAVRSSFAWSPKNARLAFATYGDPCAKKDADRTSSLYVADAATGKLKHVETGLSSWNPRWIDDDQLVYEDDKGGLRVYSAPEGRDTAQRTSKPGLALVGLGAIPPGTRVCKAKKEAYEQPEGAMPAEEEKEGNPAGGKFGE